MEWFLAYGFESIDATISSPTSEQSPDGLASNAVTFDGSALGKRWVLEAGATSGSCNVTPAAAFDPVTGVFFAHANASDDAVMRFYDGALDDPDRGLLCELTQCNPVTHLWVGFYGGDVTSTSLMSFDISDPGFDGPALEVKFGFAVRRKITGGATIDVGRDSHTWLDDDLSTQTQGQTGAVFSCRQPHQFTQTWPFLSHEDTAGLHVIQRAWKRCGKTEPILCCLDLDTFGKYGRTVLGLFTQALGATVAAGMMPGGTQAIREIVA